MKKLYHENVYMPDYLQRKARHLQVHMDFTTYVLSWHLQEHIQKRNKDHSHNYDLGTLLRALRQVQRRPRNCFEIETNNNKITKYCVRVRVNRDTDICIVVDTTRNTIRTAWLNNVNDSHSTLNTHKYYLK